MIFFLIYLSCSLSLAVRDTVRGGGGVGCHWWLMVIMMVVWWLLSQLVVELDFDALLLLSQLENWRCSLCLSLLMLDGWSNDSHRWWYWWWEWWLWLWVIVLLFVDQCEKKKVDCDKQQKLKIWSWQRVKNWIAKKIWSWQRVKNTCPKWTKKTDRDNV